MGVAEKTGKKLGTGRTSTRVSLSEKEANIEETGAKRWRDFPVTKYEYLDPAKLKVSSKLFFSYVRL